MAEDNLHLPATSLLSLRRRQRCGLISHARGETHRNSHEPGDPIERVLRANVAPRLFIAVCKQGTRSLKALIGGAYMGVEAVHSSVDVGKRPVNAGNRQ